MKRLPYIQSVLATLLLLATACSHREEMPPAKRAMYYWSTKFQLDSAKLDFIKRHGIERLYVRYFDVVDRVGQPMPNATIAFDTTVTSPCEIVPVIFIINDCMKGLTEDKSADLADKLLARVLQMNDTHDIGKVSEIQIDCDWTGSTRDSYFAFLKQLATKAAAKGVDISATIRLHQLSQPAPPVKSGVLMVYNTGDLTDINESNPILDHKIVEKYIGHITRYPLPMGAAYPVYKWDLVFRNGKFVDILHYPDEIPVLESDTVIDRHVTAEEIIRCKTLVESRNPGCHSEIILFDLNNHNTTRYTDEEFEAFFD